MKIIVRVKKDYGEDIKKGILDLLGINDVETTEEIEPGCDFAIIVGGDGTVLRDQYELDCPILSVNPGTSVGYYTEASRNDYKEKILKLIKGKPGLDYKIEKLSRLKTEINGNPLRIQALNDVLISAKFVRRIFESKLIVNNNTTVERNSGIIVFTPTGSNAFAHSAGSAGIDKKSENFGVIAIAPYSGFLKKGEIVLSQDEVTVECTSKTGEVCIDGSNVNIIDIKRGDKVTVTKSRGKKLEMITF